ncbi:MAG: hemolysin family protein [Phycisphaerae bacterium]
MNSILWAVVVVATAFAGFFSLASYSLRVLRRVQLDEAFDSSGGKRRLNVLEKHLTALKLTTSFCRALCYLVVVLAMVQAIGSEPLDLLWAGLISLAVLSVFAVAIPSAWASYAGERAVALTLPVILVFRYLLYPVIAVLQAFDLPIRRLSGRPDVEPINGENARAEILQVASESQAEGSMGPDEVEMIESVIEFGETQAAEIMTPRTDIFALPVETPTPEAVVKLDEAGHTRVPVYDGDLDNIIGILYAKDLLQYVHHSGVKDRPIREILRKPFFIPESKQLDDLLREFKQRKFHMAVVLDEYGGTAGLVTIEDVVEEIVGEIADEYDPTEEVQFKKIDDHTADVEGRMYIDDLNDLLEMDIPEDEDYDTIAGMVFSELGYIPTEGEKLEVHGGRFTVLDAEERKINLLRVEVLQDQPAEEEK